MPFPGALALLELIAEARLNPARLPVALISSGVVLSTAALQLILFKAPGGSSSSSSSSTPAYYLYYGLLVAVMIFGLAVASFGYWVAPRDDDMHAAAGKTVLWVALLPLVLVFALGGLSSRSSNSTNI